MFPDLVFWCDASISGEARHYESGLLKNRRAAEQHEMVSDDISMPKTGEERQCSDAGGDLRGIRAFERSRTQS
jgi:hypothetical protein